MSDEFGSTILVFWGQPGGGFAAPLPIATTDAATELVVADLDGDLDLDIAGAGGNIQVFKRNNGTGVRTFAAGPALAVEVGGDHYTRAAGMVAGDFDQDTDNDLVVSAYRVSSNAFAGGALRRVRNHPTGTFAHVTGTQFAEHKAVADVVTGQFDADSDPDLAFEYVDVVVTPYEERPRIGILRGAAGFDFTAGSEIIVDYLGTIEAADLDGDTEVDLIQDGSVNVHWGVGNGTFQTPQQVDNAFPYDFWTGDFDDDGVRDLAVGTGGLRVLRNLGARTFGLGGTLELPDEACQVVGAAGDFGGDARDDVVVGTCDATYLLITGDPPPPPPDDDDPAPTPTPPGDPPPSPPPPGPPMV
ncbi:MAG: VCBS repeat-containing protein, partial [Actinomycetota bacterium]|nr:VCBS repeat-containing protein [Actinomycetota bacterium]